MKKIAFLLIFMLFSRLCHAHFLILKAEKDTVSLPARTVNLIAKFSHPMEGGPQMPFEIEKAGVFIDGKILPLRWKSRGMDKLSTFRLKKPGVYQFFLVMKPYFEPSEDKFIKQIAKFYVGAYGLEEGWDRVVGLEAEIVPLTRPFGIWEGNLFRAKALINGRPCRGCLVEVEFLNELGLKVKDSSLITQVVKTDENGIFEYSIPWAGWWGFSVIGDGGFKAKNGKAFPVELDAVIWIKARKIPERVR